MIRRFLISCCIATLLVGCTVPKDKALVALQSQGYKDIELGGIALYGCDDHDDFTRITGRG